MPICVNKVRNGHASAGQGCSTAMLPCTKVTVLQPTHLPLFHIFANKKPIFKMDCAD